MRPWRLCGARGPVGVKKPRAAGGRGQRTVLTDHGLDDVLATLAPEDLALCGLELETELAPVATLSVGQVAIGKRLISYYGTQQAVTDNAGRSI